MKYFVIDTETTGVDAKQHELTEIAIIRCEDLFQKTWDVRIKHPERCQAMALEITKKTREELTNRGKYIEEVIPMVNAFLNEDGVKPEERVMIAHNYSFDQRFIEQNWKNAGMVFPAKLWCCTLAMSRKYNKINGLSAGAKLDDMIVKTGIKHNMKTLHGSTGDTQATFKLHKFLVSKGINDLEFTKASKSYLESISSPREEDPAMAELFSFED